MSAVPFWFAPEESRPICDIPWYGTAVVLANGTLHFCCHSVASPGNVNEKPFDELWNGPMMRRVRGSLSRSEFPPECRSSDCPIYRGDQHEYVRGRAGGKFRRSVTGTDDPHRAFRESIARAALAVSPDGNRARLSLTASRGLRACDVVAGVCFPDGRVRFLPDLEPVPVPCARLPGIEGDLALDFESTKGPLPEPGAYRLSIALFVPDSNPSIPANCLWAFEAEFVVNSSYGTKDRARTEANPGHHDRAGDLPHG